MKTHATAALEPPVKHYPNAKTNKLVPHLYPIGSESGRDPRIDVGRRRTRGLVERHRAAARLQRAPWMTAAGLRMLRMVVVMVMPERHRLLGLPVQSQAILHVDRLLVRDVVHITRALAYCTVFPTNQVKK